MTTAAAVREHQWIERAEWVPGLLDGTITQGRRAVKLPRWMVDAGYSLDVDERSVFPDWHGRGPALVVGGAGLEAVPLLCPYGVRGGRLWLRESYIGHASIPQLVGYVADGCEVTESWERRYASLHMPRRFCRLRMKVLDVRIERLCDISEVDAYAEGCRTRPCARCDESGEEEPGVPCEDCSGEGWHSCRAEYREMWDRVNPATPWALNPWVWAVTWRRLP